MNEKRPAKKLLNTVLVVALLIGSNLFTYFVLAKYIPVLTGNAVIISSDDEAGSEGMNKLLYIYNVLKENYLWELDNEKLWDGALKGLMEASGDPYTYYMDKEESDAYRESNAASFGGIGVQISNDEENNVIVTKVMKETPAQKAGIKFGDIIVSADDVSLVDTNVNKAVTYVRGEEGTSVKLGIKRNDKLIYISVKRATIVQNYVEHEMLSGSIGYIYISQFEDNTYAQFASALSELTAENLKGLILDLRQNPGGSVAQAIKVADEFLDEGEIIYTIDASGKKEYYYSADGKVKVPVVVMVDQYSASASEIVAAALVDNKAAVCVGKTSYGKGIMQMVRSLPDGSIYQYTFCEYFAPSGKTIHKVGITPDYEVEMDEKYKDISVETLSHENDAQLKKALSVIEDLIK